MYLFLTIKAKFIKKRDTGNILPYRFFGILAILE